MLLIPHCKYEIIFFNSTTNYNRSLKKLNWSRLRWKIHVAYFKPVCWQEVSEWVKICMQSYLSSLKPRFQNYSSDADIQTFHWTWISFDDKNNAGTLTALEVEHFGDVCSDISLGINRPTTSLPEFWIRMHNANKNRLTKTSMSKTDSVWKFLFVWGNVF